MVCFLSGNYRSSYFVGDWMLRFSRAFGCVIAGSWVSWSGWIRCFRVVFICFFFLGLFCGIGIKILSCLYVCEMVHWCGWVDSCFFEVRL